MKISIFGISHATINIIESIENFSDEIEIFGEKMIPINKTTKIIKKSK